MKVPAISWIYSVFNSLVHQISYLCLNFKLEELLYFYPKIVNTFKTISLLVGILFLTVEARAQVVTDSAHINAKETSQGSLFLNDSIAADSLLFRVPKAKKERSARQEAFPAASLSNDSIAADSVLFRAPKAKKVKLERSKMLQTHLFHDSIYTQRIFTWNHSKYLNSAQLAMIDTNLTTNRTELPFYKNDVGVTYLGATGSATQLHNYFKRQAGASDIYPFMNPYEQYARTPEEVNFYSTKGPFSDLAYYSSGNNQISEDNLMVLFTRNINPAWNFGLYYQRMGARGIYQNQATNTKSFTLFTSYTGKRYVAHLGYIYNGINNRENGGIANDFFITDTVMTPNTIEVRLKTARNRLSSNTYFLTHTYGIPLDLFNKRRDSLGIGGGTMVYFGHSFEYSRYKRIYTDGIRDTAFFDFHQNLSIRYYDNYFLSRKQSYDSSFASQLDNRAFMRIQPYSPTAILSKIDGGIGYSFERYYVFDPSFYLSNYAIEKLSTGYVYGNATGMFSKYFLWSAFLKYNLSGYRQNDLLLDATARLSLYPIQDGIHLTGRFLIDNKEPAFFTNHYFSNRLKWNENFSKTTETRVEVGLYIPAWDFNTKFSNGIISKPIYFGLDATPKQSADVLNITSVTAEKNLRLWHFHLDNRVLFQLTSDKDIVPLPLVSANVAFYFQSEWVKSVLNNQLGLDVYYNTKFYDYAYNPAAGMFHTQNVRQLGNYPWIDLFANFKWKRAIIYVKFTNAANGMIGNNDHFSALHYPRNDRMLRLGLHWYFYN